jgi:signal transduction histidine kinase
VGQPFGQWQKKAKAVTSRAGGVEYASVAELWAQAAHDLRQPVQAALLLSDMLNEASTPPDLRRTAHHIGTSLRSIYSMLEFLTVLSRLEAGLQSVPLRNCQLTDVLTATLEETAKLAAERGIALRRRNISGLVRSNPQLLAITIKSLLLNALKSGNGDQIIARCRRRADEIGFEIHFRSSALDPDSEKNAFFELPRATANISAPEIGIGLALLRRLCQRLGHKLEHGAMPAGGRRLAIWLPRVATT